MTELKLTYLGTHWGASGDLFYLTHPDGAQARVFVDSLGETWVDVRRVPEGGYFHSERVEGYRALNGAAKAERELRDRGYNQKRVARGAHRVRERYI
jgi:hypothetical protein